MEKLVHKIMSEFSDSPGIEVYVLDQAGDQVEIFKGMPGLLTINSLRRVLPDEGSFYIFSVVSVDLDQNPEDLVRKEFCWLTEPAQPVALSRTATTVSLSWAPINFCGVDPKLFGDSLQYILQGVEVIQCAH